MLAGLFVSAGSFPVLADEFVSVGSSIVLADKLTSCGSCSMLTDELMSVYLPVGYKHVVNQTFVDPNTNGRLKYNMQNYEYFFKRICTLTREQRW